MPGSSTTETLIAVKRSRTDESDEEGGGFLSDHQWDEFDDDDPDAFRVNDALPPPRKQIMTTKELHKQIHLEDIDLNPPYQRDVVWSAPKQSSLIDSIFHNYHVPEIVFVSKNVEDEDDGTFSRKLICVDGKQRLTSITRFMDGQIPRKVGKIKWWYTFPGQASAVNREVPRAWKEIFSAKEISCEVYEDISEEAEREMFRRVQLGMVLTSAEKIKAIESPMAHWIARLQSTHVEIENGLAEVLRWEAKRGKAFENVLTVVYCCENYRKEPTTLTHGNVGKWLETSQEPSVPFQKSIDKVFRDMWSIAAGGQNLNFPFTSISALVAPVEFIFIGVLLFVLRDYDLKTKATAIKSLRMAVRTKHPNAVRNNNQVSKSMWTFIKALQKHPLLDPLSNTSAVPRGPGRPAGSKKRKIAKGSDDDGDDSDDMTYRSRRKG